MLSSALERFWYSSDCDRCALSGRDRRAFAYTRRDVRRLSLKELFMRMLVLLALCGLSFVSLSQPTQAAKRAKDPRVVASVNRALDFLARTQTRQGYWEAEGGQYKVAMTALSGNALLSEGSTTTKGKYAQNIRRAVDFLVENAQPSGLIGYREDYHYTYGHGFAMLFLSQVFGEEEDSDRRAELKKVLTKAVEFSAQAQTNRGGWGYVSAKDQPDFDEGSTCVTQVQGLRACRNAGIAVPLEIVDKAKKYIKDCTTPDGGVMYSIRTQGGGRPPITAAAVASMFNAGEYDSDHVKKLMAYCERNISVNENQAQTFGHWHYTHYYMAQVRYRQGDEVWNKYIDQVRDKLLPSQSASGAWKEGHVGEVYVTAINATILQLDNGYLPIYQR